MKFFAQIVYWTTFFKFLECKFFFSGYLLIAFVSQTTFVVGKSPYHKVVILVIYSVTIALS